MITGQFTCEAGTVTVEIDAGTATGTLLSVGSIKYTFDITPDSVVIDRLMAVYSRLDCTWALYSPSGQDLYDLLSVISGRADATVTVNTWAGDSYVFPFVLEAKDVSLDEKTQIIKTSFGIYADQSVTVGDVWDEISTNHSGDIFTFRVPVAIGGVSDFDAVSVPKWYEVAMELVFGDYTTVFKSYNIEPNPPEQEPPDLLVYSPVPIDAPNNGKPVYVCMDVDGLTFDTGVDAESVPATEVMQTMAGHEGGIFGSGFSTNFYVNRASVDVPTVTITYDDVLELGFERNYKAFRFVRTGVIEKFLDSASSSTPTILTQSIDSIELNANAEKIVNLQLNAGFPIMNAGTIDNGLTRVNANNPPNEALMVSYGLEAAQYSYLKALPAEGALKIATTIYGWGRVKPWELLQFDATAPVRYQARRFRINDASYDFTTPQTKLVAYEVDSYIAEASRYIARVVADSGAVASASGTQGAIFPIYTLPRPVIYLLNGFKESSGAIDKWYNLLGADGTSSGTNRPVKSGLGADFDGSNDYIQIAHNVNQQLTTGGTLMAWIKPDTAGEGNAGRIFCKTSTTTGYQATMLSNGGVQFAAVNGAFITSPAGVFTYPSPVFKHIAFVFTAAGAVTIYVNGVSVATGNTNAASGISATGLLFIGALSTTLRFFNGRIALPLVTSKQYTSAELLDYVNRTKDLPL